MSFLLDTNILSELRKPVARRNPGVEAWSVKVHPEAHFLSVLVVGEVRKGIEQVRRNDRAQARAIEDWLGQIEDLYADRILPVTAAIATRWGRAQSVRTYPVVDGLMAATADEHGLQLVSRNTRDLAGWPAERPHLNPWTA